MESLNIKQLESKGVRKPVLPVILPQHALHVIIGNSECRQSYTGNVFDIQIKDRTHFETIKKPEAPGRAMLQETGREKMDLYELIGGEEVLQLSYDYRGCRNKNGGFESAAFRSNAVSPSVKLIELNLVNYNRHESISNVKTDIKNFSTGSDSSTFRDFRYSVFSDAEGMILFLATLQDLSGGKPVGFKMCMNNKKHFYQICYAIKKTCFIPNFIVIASSDKKPCSPYFEDVINNTLMLYEALTFISNTLKMYGLHNHIKIIVAGTQFSALGIMKMLAIGASAIWAEMPGFKVSGSTHTEKPLLYNKQNVPDLHRSIIDSLIVMMEVSGFKSVKEITLPKLLLKLDVIV